MTEDRLPPPAEKTRLITWLDVVIIGSVAALLILTYYRVEHVLVYNWNWGLVFQYLVHIDEVTGEVFPNLFLKGVAMTLRLAFWGTVIAGIIGIVMGLCRVSNSLFLKLGSRIYVELIRNIPPVVFIFVFYFFISSQIIPLLGLDRIKDITDPTTVAVIELLFGPLDLFENFLAGLICLAVFESAYITEIVRAGIQSIDKGQWEAARAIGLSRFFVFWDVILPQALKTILPPLAGQFITLVKDSSIVSLISVQELTFLTQDVSNTTTHFFESWMITAVLYFAMCFPLAVLFQRFERAGIGIQRQ
ncbi:MAG: amino acid ABC transporter permease [Gammaproteobacteria bacterium]|nr:amino acid ABC transporter permease [Gammaproteobacteria bacterium]MYI89163.1 amino acid ABC transporter permease [Gammaproteobacteria bacterium]